MYLEAAALLILIQVGWVGYNFYQLFQEMDFVQPVMAQEVKERPAPLIYAYQQSEKVGLNPANLVRIITCESALDPKALNGNHDGSVDMGIAQWNNKAHPEISIEEKLDPYKSIDLMIKTRLHDKNYHQWSCSRLLKIPR